MGSIIFGYYPDIIRYPGYPRIGLLSARPDRIIYPPQVWTQSRAIGSGGARRPGTDPGGQAGFGQVQAVKSDSPGFGRSG